MIERRGLWALTLCAVLLALAACGAAGADTTGNAGGMTAGDATADGGATGGDGTAAGSATAHGDAAAKPSAASAGTVSGNVTVFAAASLTDAFTELGTAFEAAHPGTTVTYNFAGSQQLAAQITTGGAPADVFASANPAQMASAVAADVVSGEPAVFARNRLEIAVEPGNPAGISGLEDLGRDDLAVVLAADQVPAGQYAREALTAAGVPIDPVSLETDVRSVLTKVALGEADAGVVYASDVAAANGRVDGVSIPDEANVVATYPIAVLQHAPNPVAARAFVDFVRADVARDVLEAHGFGAP
jgi:molybdate transport system substrate-binding protein